MGKTFFEVSDEVSIVEILNIWKQDVVAFDGCVVKVMKWYRPTLRKYVFTARTSQLERQAFGR